MLHRLLCHVAIVAVAVLVIGLFEGCEQRSVPEPPPHDVHGPTGGDEQSSNDLPKSTERDEQPQDRDPGPTATEKPSAAATDKDPDLKPPLDGWPEPKAVIILTGEQHGYIEPCGCSATQSGGIARRADLLRQIGEKKWPYTAFDLGGLVKRNREQSRLKFQTLLSALRDMGYRALAMGPEELRFGADMLLSQHVVDSDNPQTGLTFLAANVVLFDTPDLGTPARWRIVRVGKIQIGVTAILGASLKGSVFPQGANVDITIGDPAVAIADVLGEMKAKEPDLLVLLSHATLKESKELAKKYPDFDLVLSAADVEDPIHDNPQSVGNTMVATVGHKTKYVGVVGYYPQDPKHRFRFELVDLDKWRFREMDTMREHMRSYQKQLQDWEIAVTEARELAIPHPRNAQFVGAEVCSECHTQAYDKWSQTGHSHAFESLITGREGKQEGWISRIYDPECIACHVVGWHPQDIVPYDNGFVDQETTPQFKNVQCENCHGPGSRHVELAENDEVKLKKNEMIVTLEEAKSRLCYGCHDLDNSPGFDFDTYWPKMEHHGVD